jgi:DNA-binding HxlR family transcriptional regulator
VAVADEVVLDRYCPYFHHSVELLGRRWTGVVLLAMHDGVERFGTLRDTVPGLSDRLLAERLRELESEGVVARDACGADVRYRLTDKGRALRPVLEALAVWTQQHCVTDPASA